MKWDEFVNSLDEAAFKELSFAVKCRQGTFEQADGSIFTEEEIKLWTSRDKIRALKSFRRRTDAGLKQAKDLFEKELGY